MDKGLVTLIGMGQDAEAIEIIRRCFAGVHPEMGAFVEMMVERGWIDAAPQPRKQLGAFCGSFAAHRTPIVFMTWGNSMSDVLTLAHELGHSYLDEHRNALAAGFKPCRECTPLRTGIADPPWLVPLMSEVETDPGRRWHDHDLEMMGLDPDRVRRWFVANHGLTFHAYTRLRRLGLALRQVQAGSPVERAVLASGFESEAGFREAFAQVFGNPPSAVDRESSIWVNRVATPLGSMIVGVHDGGLCLLAKFVPALL